jgi:hypothetical protein
MELRIGTTGHLRYGIVQKLTFARFLASFDFRLFQHYRPAADLIQNTKRYLELDDQNAFDEARLVLWGAALGLVMRTMARSRSLAVEEIALGTA